MALLQCLLDSMIRQSTPNNANGRKSEDNVLLIPCHPLPQQECEVSETNRPPSSDYALMKTTDYGGRGGSVGRASASRSNGIHGQRFESRPEHKKNL